MFATAASAEKLPETSSESCAWKLDHRKGQAVADGGVEMWMNADAFIPAIVRTFSNAECRSIVELGKSLSFETGQTVNLPEGHRRCECAWIEPGAVSNWIYERVAHSIRVANERFNFDVAAIVEPLMYVVYRAGDGFDWHMDCGPSVSSARKISVTIQLSDPASYVGGDLQFFGAQADFRPRERGIAIAFPAFLFHRIAPIASGERHALVAWAYGPTFR